MNYYRQKILNLLQVASAATIMNEPIYGPYMAEVQKSHVRSEWTNQI